MDIFIKTAYILKKISRIGAFSNSAVLFLRLYVNSWGRNKKSKQIRNFFRQSLRPFGALLRYPKFVARIRSPNFDRCQSLLLAVSATGGARNRPPLHKGGFGAWLVSDFFDLMCKHQILQFTKQMISYRVSLKSRHSKMATFYTYF